MIRRVVTLLLCISVALVVFAGKAKINAEDRLENTAKLGPERGQFIIGYKQGITASPARSRLDEAREAARHWPAELQNCVTVLNEVPALAISLVELSPACNIEEVAQAMSKDDVEYVEPNRRLYLLERNISATIVPLSLAANDPFFSQQWALARISAPDGWSVFPGSFSAPSGTPIAVVDTGVDSSHPDLAQKIIRARSIVQNSSPLVDEVGHGTAVASLALAAANNGFGIAGLAFNSPLVPVKVSVDGSASTFDLAEGLRYAADPAGGGARVINVSFGSDEPSPTISRAIEFARANGALVIAAAGNCGSGESAACSTINANRWPAAFATSLDNVIAVAATNQNDERADFSNFGDYITVAAPGANVTFDSPFGANGIASGSGTSYSAPYVAGLAALLLSQNPSRSYLEIKSLIVQGADKIGDQPYDSVGRNNFFGFGRINVLRSLQSGSTPAEGVDGKIEVVFPHDEAGNPRPVNEATLVNVQALLFRAGTLEPVSCGDTPILELWRSLNNDPAELVARARPIITTDAGVVFPAWVFNDIDVTAVTNPANKYYFFLRAPELTAFRTNIWSHGADARTIFPTQDIPTSIGTSPTQGPLDGRIEVVFPHDAAGNEQPITQAPLVNLGIDLFEHGTLRSVPRDFSRTIRVTRALNNDVEDATFEGERTLITRDGLTYPRWVFNDIVVAAAQNPLNKYYFRVDIDFPTIWAHGADARTIFPQKDVPTTSGPGCR